MNENVNQNPEWISKGKTIKELIRELESFENQELEVKISLDSGESFQGISLVVKRQSNDKDICGLINYE